jgi:hypothetical protein
VAQYRHGMSRSFSSTSNRLIFRCDWRNTHCKFISLVAPIFFGDLRFPIVLHKRDSFVFPIVRRLDHDSTIPVPNETPRVYKPPPPPPPLPSTQYINVGSSLEVQKLPYHACMPFCTCALRKGAKASAHVVAFPCRKRSCEENMCYMRIAKVAQNQCAQV